MKILHSRIILHQISIYSTEFLQNYIFSPYFVCFSVDKVEIPALLQYSDQDIDTDMQILHFCSFAAALPSRSMRQGIIGAARGPRTSPPLPPILLVSLGYPEFPLVSLSFSEFL